jgi:polyisoprenoid-binding protein YceI
MRPVLAVLALTFFPATHPAGQAPLSSSIPLFDVESAHSQVEFSVPFMGLSYVRGSFEDFGGTLTYDAARLENSSVTVVLQAASLHTGNSQRDRHLASSDFFDVTRYPVLVFESRSIEHQGSGFLARGLLTIHGVTRPVAIPFTERHAPVLNRNGVDYLGYDAALRLNWREFGIQATSEHNSWFQPANMLVNDSVEITLSINAVRRHLATLHIAALDTLLSQVRAHGPEAFARDYRALAAVNADSARRIEDRLENLAAALSEQGQDSAAIVVERLHVEIAPQSADARAALAAAYAAAGRSDEAAAACREALALDPYQTLARELSRRFTGHQPG